MGETRIKPKIVNKMKVKAYFLGKEDIQVARMTVRKVTDGR